MKTIWTLVRKDLLRDARHPWGLIVFMIIPVLTAVIMSLVFAPQNDIRKNVRIDVAVLDRDDDFLSRVLRSMSGQGQAAQNLRLRFVESEEEGIRLVERRKVSAFVVLPEKLTVDLLDGAPTSLTLYKNPAQAILPRIVEEGLQVVCIGVSEVLNLVQPQIKAIRDMVERESMPESLEVAQVASSSVQRLRTVEPYLFPPLIQFKTINASVRAKHRFERTRNGGSGPMKEVFQFVFPGLMLMWVCFIANGVFADIFEEYKAHTIWRLVSSGVTLGEVLLSKIIRCLVVCWICELLLILFTGVVFGVAWRNPLALFVILTSFNVFLIGLLSLVYASSRSTDLANAIVIFVLLVAAVLGGSFVPFNELPQVLQAVGRWTMIRLANYGIESLFQSRPIWESLWPSLLLAAGGAILAATGTTVLRKRFESGGAV